MKITRIISHVLQYDMPEILGYSQQYYASRTAHLVEVQTDEASQVGANVLVQAVSRLLIKLLLKK